MEQKVNELNNVRKLATIAKILRTEPIPGADNIEKVFVRGWQCVAKKNEFKPGDLCVYVEVDSILPDGLAPELQEQWRAHNKAMSKTTTDEERDNLRSLMNEIVKHNTRPEFEFMRAGKFHVKTKRILGEISQGLCLPLSILPTDIDIVLCYEDEDVTELLGVTQYVAPESTSMGGNAKGMLANVGLLVTDEERCLKENTLIETEDGLKTIKEICETKYTGQILSYNLETLEEEWQPIMNHKIMKNNNDWYKITLENEKTIIATSNHRFYLPELNCYRYLRDLKIGQKLLINDSKI